MITFVIAALLGCSGGDSGEEKEGGGGLSMDAYVDEYIAATCSKAVECYGDTTMSVMPFSDEASCIAYYEDAMANTTATTTVECNYDAAKAQECVDGMNAMTCDDMLAGTYPEACMTVCG